MIPEKHVSTLIYGSTLSFFYVHAALKGECQVFTCHGYAILHNDTWLLQIYYLPIWNRPIGMAQGLYSSQRIFFTRPDRHANQNDEPCQCGTTNNSQR